ncbi:GMC family oxidoreductase [Streptomyces litmocidini]|uniref:GMC family oxidoreductase n=1 Tax=Streptomyces litmocidini TaxID=67318 RepID=UPI0033E3FADA
MTVTTTGSAVDGRHYDVVIVGSGWAGSLLARHLGKQNWRVLVLEAGNGGTDSWEGFQDTVRTFSSAVIKVPNAAYRKNAAAPFPDVLDLRSTGQSTYTASGHFKQTGPFPYGTDYIRALGGAAMHWLGAVPRMFPEDYATRTKFQYGADWPITAEALERHVREAELLIGTAGDGAAQAELGVVKDTKYQYPMEEIPPSYQDRRFRELLKGASVKDETAGIDYPLKVYGLPQGRNSTPNPAWTDGSGKPYRPRGAVGVPNFGERCVGNASCTPICPVQAKSLPLKLQQDFTDSVHVATRCVVSRVLPGRGGTVRGVEFREYGDPATATSRPYSVEADIVVLAAHAIENAVLLLASGMANSSDNVGRHLMDHPTLLAWAEMPKTIPIGPFRGPGHTSGLECFRTGQGRKKRAPFRVEIGNWGWGWATGAPLSSVARMLALGGDASGDVLDNGYFGPKLRHGLGQQINRQVQLQIAVEQHADRENRVTIDPARHRDGMGNPRPIIHYDLDQRVKDGLYAARAASVEIFKVLGAKDRTKLGRQEDGSYPLGYFSHSPRDGLKALDLGYHGAGHGAGTHIMGTQKSTSVVDSYQRTHDHPNLYAVGCGSMPSIGTSNPTLTMAALALRSAERIHRDLAELHQPVTVAAGKAAAK